MIIDIIVIMDINLKDKIKVLLIMLIKDKIKEKDIYVTLFNIIEGDIDVEEDTYITIPDIHIRVKSIREVKKKENYKIFEDVQL